MPAQIQLRASDVMTSEMIPLDHDAPIHEAAAVLIDNEISGAPARDEIGRVVGIISALDVLSAQWESG